MLDEVDRNPGWLESLRGRVRTITVRRYSFQQLTLAGDGAIAYSGAIAKEDSNSCGCVITMLALTGTTPNVNVTLQVSYDRENWAVPSLGPATSQDVDAVGVDPLDPVTAILAPYIRLKFTLTGDLAVFSGNVTFFNE